MRLKFDLDKEQVEVGQLDVQQLKTVQPDLARKSASNTVNGFASNI